MMPAGLLATLSRDKILDLIAYLKFNLPNNSTAAGTK